MAQCGRPGMMCGRHVIVICGSSSRNKCPITTFGVTVVSMIRRICTIQVHRVVHISVNHKFEYTDNKRVTL